MIIEDEYSLADAISEMLEKENFECKICVNGERVAAIRNTHYKPKQIVNKESLMNKILGYNDDSEYNNVEVYISFLRRKLRLLHSRVTIKAGYKDGYTVFEVVIPM